MICVLDLPKLNGYTKDRLIEEGIPFVVQEKQIYLPFLGVALSNEDERVIKPCERLSFLTQKLLFQNIFWIGTIRQLFREKYFMQYRRKN